MRVTTRKIAQMKRKSERIVMVTAYDAMSAGAAERAGIPMILVGDSLGQVVLGHDSTVPVSMDDMVSHAAAVARCAPSPLIVADLPFLSYQVSEEIALTNAARLLQEGGAQAVKLEGGVPVAATVKRLTDSGIAVMGHIGFTPQSVHQLGGYRVQGRTEDAAARLLEDALALQDAGAFAVVLELVPTEVAASVTERLSIPTIGIGAGPECDGQIQVFHDLLGLLPDFRPKHAGRYGDLAGVIDEALSRYADDVKGNKFPTEAESFSISTGSSQK
ncbi:MAG: 3-methyl-2-oxobutanoate hydroxymethyltransferase [Chloroflexi bacterium]|jgi:3-methyl-2-oxobutanoate hydroxymethyltransferase|nr:3-methyl-2-oxobutanoate hydroxymethyltransferase [Chloroflexota bacterium]MBT4073286.1 3-methyl-2-oxobutanoate hydroxymethyltransferase [Chloroflexota bacterium]MBT4513894.1 3-methyl-2-oxobutanoate hydroxymethyltransferase [Chloroflexota bacterium]MBT5319105.1 3-methyl-2-oxobutanoate hydroxymethyltransferase [Chloroflexota bacterium]MBT6680480.1 3-methyl-2-oxobutanoate hydroxymethyltransferase [Chloroflexota bacterium]